MLGHRVLAGLAVFGVAGLCALLAIFWSPVWMVTVALWFGAGWFVVLGFRTLLGRVGRTESPDPPGPVPVSVRPPGPGQPARAEVTDAVVASGKRIVQGMWTVTLVLSLLVLVPVTLLLALVSVFQFRDGQLVNGFLALGAAVCTGGFAADMIRRRKSPSISISE